MKIPTSGLRQYILELAERHGVVYTEGPLDRLAATISRLSDAEVDSDELEDLLVALKHAGVISGQDMVTLLGAYLDRRVTAECRRIIAQ